MLTKQKTFHLAQDNKDYFNSPQFNFYAIIKHLKSPLLSAPEKSPTRTISPVITSSLPITQVLPELKSTLANSPQVVLQAPPGAGKSTFLPLELLDEPWLTQQKIIMLQPRRVAARAVASRLAESLGEQVGQTVGYRVRFESKVSKNTRLEVVTEGILLRRLQRDPELEGIGLVILDEFHERSLNADLSLVLLREVQEALRDDLKLLIMSATLDPQLPQQLSAPLVKSEGRSYPIDIRYLPQDSSAWADELVAQQVKRALETDQGDILAFLPGVREITGAQAKLQALKSEFADQEVQILALYGNLPLKEQQRAILPDPKGRRKVVLATNIAETSLTIQGVRVVIDGGLSRHQHFDPKTGLTRMQTSRVTQDSATQRAGRAGRTAPGIAYRLWSERTQALLSERRPPEILEADLSPLTLELAHWGSNDPANLPWLDAPPAHRIARARELLGTLEALDQNGRVTQVGEQLLHFPTHPRLAHLLMAGQQQNLGALAADVAAVLEERDPLPNSAGYDLSERVEALRSWRRREPYHKHHADQNVLERIERLAKQWRKLLNVQPDHQNPDPYAVGQLVALAYPERVALARQPQQTATSKQGRFLLAGGQGAALTEGDALANLPALAIAHLDAGKAEGRIFLAAPLDQQWLTDRAKWQDQVSWNNSAGVLVAQQEQRLGALLLNTRPLKQLTEEQRWQALAAGIRSEGLKLLHFSPAAKQLRLRLSALHHWQTDQDWPNVSDQALLETLETWLAPHFGRARSREDLAKIDLFPALKQLIPWSLISKLDEDAPTHLTVPSGSRVRLEYRPDGETPILAVKLQELFGLADTPTVNAGRTPVLLHLLSPAGRPVQVTSDLKSFWNSSYFEVRKDMRGRYPKHPWPEDPWNHVPTKKTKKRLK